MRILVCFLIGGLFGAGLAVSGMMNPAKVIGFLDLAADWDPTLAVVMAAALAISAAGYAVRKGRARPVLADTFQVPPAGIVDARLIAGGALFGLGWGIAGFCPGPAIAALSTGRWDVAIFVVSMVAGVAAFSLMPKAK
ncbi:MAG: DUF6691 family protein [Alphaproteobacteria bacterium]|jgi:uncharacterized membrane protein YedE/YeeE